MSRSNSLVELSYGALDAPITVILSEAGMRAADSGLREPVTEMASDLAASGVAETAHQIAAAGEWKAPERATGKIRYGAVAACFAGGPS